MEESSLVPKRWFKKIDHVGIAVPSLATALPLYEGLLGQSVEHVEEVEEQQVKTAFFRVGESHFELLESTHPEGPIGRFLSKGRKGIHHLCVEVTDIEAVLAHYRELGIRLIDQVPKRGAHNKLVAFVHPASTGGILLELSQDAPAP